MTLIRQGEGPEGLARALSDEIERAKKVAKIIDDANAEEPEGKAPKMYGLGDLKQYLDCQRFRLTVGYLEP